MCLVTSTKGMVCVLLFIHGIISDKNYFNEMKLCLNKGYKIILMDRKGYGENVAVENLDFSVKRQAKEALEFLKANTTSPVYIIGHSAGGFIALEMLIQDPSLIKGILLFESSIGLCEEDKERLLGWNRELDKYIESNRILKAIPSFTKLIGNNGKKGKSNDTDLKRLFHNLENFMYREKDEIYGYLPDVEKLNETDVPIVMGISEDGKNEFFGSISMRDAEILGIPIVYFPGNHNAIKENTQEFLGILQNIIT